MSGTVVIVQQKEGNTGSELTDYSLQIIFEKL